MYYKVMQSIDLYIYIYALVLKRFKQFILLYTKNNILKFLVQNHVRISIRSTRYMGLKSVFFTTRTGG
jgi:hypothetical protein